MMPACPRCRRFYRIKKTGLYFEEGMPLNSDREEWTSYKLWAGDLYECEGCGGQVIVGVPSHHIAEHYQPDYTKLVAILGVTLRIDDCPGCFDEMRAKRLKGFSE